MKKIIIQVGFFEKGKIRPKKTFFFQIIEEEGEKKEEKIIVTSSKFKKLVSDLKALKEKEVFPRYRMILYRNGFLFDKEKKVQKKVYSLSKENYEKTIREISLIKNIPAPILETDDFD